MGVGLTDLGRISNCDFSDLYWDRDLQLLGTSRTVIWSVRPEHPFSQLPVVVMSQHIDVWLTLIVLTPLQAVYKLILVDVLHLRHGF